MMTTFDWPNNYFKIGESMIVPENDGMFLLFQIQRKDGQTHLEFPRSFHEREENIAGITERQLHRRDMFVSKISGNTTLADNRSEMYHD